MKNKLRKKGYRLKSIWAKMILKDIKNNKESFTFTFKGFKLLFSDLYRNGRNGRKKSLKV